MTTGTGLLGRLLFLRRSSAALLLIGYSLTFTQARAQTLQNSPDGRTPNSHDAKAIFAKLDAVEDATKYENGFFITRRMPDKVIILDRHGKSLLDARLLPREENAHGSIDDVAISRNGVIVVGYF